MTPSASRKQVTKSFPSVTSNPTSTTTASSSSSSLSSNKNRQYAHLHSQLAQLNAQFADTQNLVGMTAVQAQDIRFLGGYLGALFMGSARVLGEDSLGQQGGGKEGADEENRRLSEEK